jgi:2-iminobutanoate/2-iminopropanoate deaminase
MPNEPIQRVRTDQAPMSPGVPSSQAVIAAGLVHCSGQIAIDPQTNQMVDGGLDVQIRQALQNLDRLLQAAGSSLQHIVKITIYLRDISRLAQFNAIYAQLMPAPYPPRTVVEVTGLARGALVEFDALAVLKES